jgi:hypothetical protein
MAVIRTRSFVEQNPAQLINLLARTLDVGDLGTKEATHVNLLREGYLVFRLLPFERDGIENEA